MGFDGNRMETVLWWGIASYFLSQSKGILNLGMPLMTQNTVVFNPVLWLFGWLLRSTNIVDVFCLCEIILMDLMVILIQPANMQWSKYNQISTR